MDDDSIQKINDTISQYFETNSESKWIPIKQIMPDLVKAGVFRKDVKKGQPLRVVLRELDKKAELEKIPSVHAERKDGAVYWYLVKEGEKYESSIPKDFVSKKEFAKQRYAKSDEAYLTNLADEFLQEKASRQHKFSFLLGDYHKDGKTQTALPLDAYYQKLNLVIEFNDSSKVIEDNRRKAQQVIYADRKRDVLKEEGIRLAEIDYSVFQKNEEGKLKRDRDMDIVILHQQLSQYLPPVE